MVFYRAYIRNGYSQIQCYVCIYFFSCCWCCCLFGSFVWTLLVFSILYVCVGARFLYICEQYNCDFSLLNIDQTHIGGADFFFSLLSRFFFYLLIQSNPIQFLFSPFHCILMLLIFKYTTNAAFFLSLSVACNSHR